jgi:hypothetical protein
MGDGHSAVHMTPTIAAISKAATYGGAFTAPLWQWGARPLPDFIYCPTQALPIGADTPPPPESRSRQKHLDCEGDDGAERADDGETEERFGGCRLL